MIVSARIVDVDVFSLLPDDDVAYCNFVRIRHGSVVGVSTVRLSTGVGADERDMLTLAIQHAVENIADGELAREVIVPFLPSTTLLFDGVTFTVPKRGEKLDLLEFSRKSARIYRAEQLKNLEIKNPERHTDRLMTALQKELRLDRQPRHIECFDNSNLQGSHPVASCVVFRDGKPSRKEYRHFNVKTVEGPDDYASMREIVYRRYSRLVAEGAELPDLIIADGGKGQMGAIHEVLEHLQLDIPIAGLAKDARHRTAELLCGYPPLLVGLRPTSPLFHLLSHIQEEVHRFAISFHRQKRSKDFIHSELEQIPGVGEKPSASFCSTSAPSPRSRPPVSRSSLLSSARPGRAKSARPSIPRCSLRPVAFFGAPLSLSIAAYLPAAFPPFLPPVFALQVVGRCFRGFLILRENNCRRRIANREFLLSLQSRFYMECGLPGWRNR